MFIKTITVQRQSRRIQLLIENDGLNYITFNQSFSINNYHFNIHVE